MNDLERRVIAGKSITVRGNDIDTDRITPARFLKCITFDEVGQAVFFDDREQMRSAGRVHPFDDPARQDARILLVNKNFGCGSSREHAPQGLRRWNEGIQAIIGESFAEIFFGNSVAQGMPCLIASESDIQLAMSASEANPDLVFTADLEKMTLSFGDAGIPLQLAEGPRRQLLEGRWDATIELLEAEPMIRAKAAELTYFRNGG